MLLVCRLAHFALQERPYRNAIWAKRQSNMGAFARPEVAHLLLWGYNIGGYQVVRDAHAKFAYSEKNITRSKILEFWRGLCKVNSEFLTI